jgi:hypothetical protein
MGVVRVVAGVEGEVNRRSREVIYRYSGEVN